MAAPTIDPFEVVKRLTALRDSSGGPGGAAFPANSPQVRRTAFGAMGTPQSPPGGPGGIVAGDWQATLSPAERFILMKESGLNPTAKNPTSSAFGIWQGLESTRKAYLGPNYQTTDPVMQLDAFRRYVKDRYGTPENAQAFWQRNHWY